MKSPNKERKEQAGQGGMEEKIARWKKTMV